MPKNKTKSKKILSAAASAKPAQPKPLGPGEFETELRALMNRVAGLRGPEACHVLAVMELTLFHLKMRAQLGSAERWNHV